MVAGDIGVASVAAISIVLAGMSIDRARMVNNRPHLNKELSVQ